MTIAAQDIIRAATQTLVDDTSIRWTLAELCGFFNDGQRHIVTERPDAGAVTASHTLAAGARQALPATGLKLIDIQRNTGGTKRAVRQCSRTLLDAQLPGWQGLAGSVEIQHFMFDEREPRAFYVYPPAAATGASVELVYAAAPTDISDDYDEADTIDDVTGDLALADQFANALREYILHRAYSKDTEHPANRGRAQDHYAAFAAGIGIDGQATVGVAPRKKSLAAAGQG